MARRLDAVVDLHPTWISSVSSGSVLVQGASRIRDEARSHIIKALGADDVVFDSVVRHSEATAHAARERGLLAHELESEARKGPAWWQIRRGEAAATGAPRTASGVAEDYQNLAGEIVARITAAEQSQTQAVTA